MFFADVGFEVLKQAFECTRDSKHHYQTLWRKTNAALIKIGQFPSVADFQIPQVKKYRKILGHERYTELTKGIGLVANGVGIGSFVYLRRIFESLIIEAFKEAKAANAITEAEYKDARMDKKILLLKDYLPPFLVEHKTLYSILSKGLHNLTEDECLKYFEAVKIGVEQILDEKIHESEKQEKAAKAKKAIQGVSEKIAQPI
jgi:hypothetical protein